MNFHQALTEVYRENPCQVLPNALWKSLSWAEQFETDFLVDGDKVVYLLAEGTDQLMLFWNQSRQPPELYPERAVFLKFALLHQDYVSALPEDFLPKREAYFRLIHLMENMAESSLPAGFRFQSADPHSETDTIAHMIDRCYATIQPTPQTVAKWIQHPVFDPALWIWVIDESDTKPVGLGIAEFDPSIKEGSLEWIQVMPEYRGQGLGTQIVNELLNRLNGRADFVTVSGKIDNAIKPEMLYRRCGFEGDDIWWVLRSQGRSVLHP